MLLLIGLTGMPGAGKGAVHEALKQFNIPIIEMGDIVRNEAKKLGLPLTSEVLGGIALSLRAEGQDAVAKRCGKIIKELLRKNPKTRVIIVDGIRSVEELKYFKENFDPMVFVAVHASPKTRFERLVKRERSDDFKTWEEFQTRDQREILLGIGGAIALADYVILNTGSLSELHKNSKELFKRILMEYNIGEI
ncbi:MAG: AAA family ATPase [Candidatus Odinarchaeia archaeon]